MSSTPDGIVDTELPCHRCGYDVRAQPADGICPECATSVEASRKMALIPRWPGWRDSDPRWRRRMVAGMWVLSAVPVLAVLQVFDLDMRIPVPTLFRAQLGSQTLDKTFLDMVYTYLVFCIGVVLLFSKQRGRQAHRFDWTRRWGIMSSYIVLLLGVPQFLFITSLVLAGISALFIGMPYDYQPPVTEWFIGFSTASILYGPHPSVLASVALATFSSVVILLACVPLHRALRSSGLRVGAWFLLAPWVVGAIVGLHGAADTAVTTAPGGFNVPNRIVLYFFSPMDLARGLRLLWNEPDAWHTVGRIFLFELSKWMSCFAIAVWLSVAQMASWRSRHLIAATGKVNDE